MNVFRFQTINSGYKQLVAHLLRNPDDYQKVEKTGRPEDLNKKSRFHLRNVHILFKKPSEFSRFNMTCIKRSGIMNNYMDAERELFDNGVIDSNEMGKISKIWKLIENPDKTINANYGYMVYHLRDAGNKKFTHPDEFMSQWEWCQNRLKKNIHTLQAVMHFNRPKDQYLENLDQPCTVFCQFTVVKGELNFHSFMRSNDVIYGTPYNLAYFKLLQERMLKYLNEEVILRGEEKLKMGHLHHNVTSLHLYEDKIDIAKSITGIQ